ncbi:MATE family efflux transporter [Vibrio campbellii]
MKFTNYHWSLLANLSQSVFAWLVLMSMVKTGNQQDLGLYTYVQSIVLPIQLFFTLKLRTIQNSDINDEFSYYEYNSLRVLMSLLNLVSIVVIVFALDMEQKAVYIVMALTYSLYILRESYISLVQKINRNDVFFKMNIVSGVISFLMFLGPYLYTGDLVLSLAISCCSRILVYVTFERTISTKFILELTQKRKDNSAYIIIFRKAWPLAITALVGALFTSIPRVILETELGINELAIYGALSSLLFFINILVNSFVQSSLPDFAKLYEKSTNDFVKAFFSITARLVAISLLCFVLVYFLGETFLIIVFTPEYFAYTSELLMIFISGVALSLFSIGNLLLSSQRNFNIQLPIYVVVAVLIFFFSTIFIPKLGMLGAIGSQIISYAFGFALCVFYFLIRCRNAENVKV